MLAAMAAGVSALAADRTTPKSGPLAYIAVTGAPGDGGTALSAALAKRMPDGVDVKEALAQLQAEYALRGVNLIKIGSKWTSDAHVAARILFGACDRLFWRERLLAARRGR